MRYILILISLFVGSLSVAQFDSLSVREVQDLVRSMFEKDQELRKACDPASFEELRERQSSMITQMDQMHNIILHKLAKDPGYPDVPSYGMECMHQFWVLVMHQDKDIELQKDVLSWLISMDNEHETIKRDRAMLQDRVAVNEGKCQTYGTQFEFDKVKSRKVPFEICDKRKLKKLRKKMSLRSFKTQVEEENSKR